MFIYVCICMYIYIYIYIEREREIHIYIYIYICIHAYKHTYIDRYTYIYVYIHIYIYISCRERERAPCICISFQITYESCFVGRDAAAAPSARPAVFRHWACARPGPEGIWDSQMLQQAGIREFKAAGSGKQFKIVFLKAGRRRSVT